MVSKALRGTPTRFASFHLCFPKTPYFQVARKLLTFLLNAGKSVTRIKFHTEQTKMKYELMGFGIPASLIPTTGTGTLKTREFSQWLKAKNILDGLEKSNDTDDDARENRIQCPGVRDVIFRAAGKHCLLNPGNITFRGMFEKYHSEHTRVGQTEKKKLIWKIVEEIDSLGGRFLTWDKRGWWVPLEDRAEIRKKVAVSLRDYNRQRKAANNQQFVQSSTYDFNRQDGKRAKRMSSGEAPDDSRERCTNCLA